MYDRFITNDDIGGPPIRATKSNPKSARVAATLATGYLYLVLSTTVFAWWSPGLLRLEPILVLVVSAGFRLPLLAGGLVVFILGYLEDALGGGVLGLRLTALVFVYVACSLARRSLEIRSWPLQMITVGLVSLIYQLTVIGGLALLGLPHPAPANLAWAVFLQALISAVTAPVFLGILEGVYRIFAGIWELFGRREL